MAKESEPPNSAAETIGESGARERLTGQSPVRFRRDPSPKTPRTGGCFHEAARNERLVSAARDYMAVGAGECEPVSGRIP